MSESTHDLTVGVSSRLRTLSAVSKPSTSQSGFFRDKKAIIFCHGDKTDISRVKETIDKKTLIIACDGGAEHAISLGLIPDVVIGDFDSLSEESTVLLKKHHVQLIKYPQKKDYTDSELALLLAVEKGATDLTLVGTLGSRVDHFLANIFMLANPVFAKVSLRILEGNQEVFLIREKISLIGKKGELVSLIPLAGDVVGVTTSGLEYPLKNSTLVFGEARGISNVLIRSTASISIKNGLLLVVHTTI